MRRNVRIKGGFLKVLQLAVSPAGGVLIAVSWHSPGSCPWRPGATLGVCFCADEKGWIVCISLCEERRERRAGGEERKRMGGGFEMGLGLRALLTLPHCERSALR